MFFGYMTKDLVGIYPIGAVYVLHHIVCIFLVTSFLFLDLPPLFMIAGGTFAEIGSAAINSYEMGYAFGSNFMRIFFAVVMTISNLAVLWLLYPYNMIVEGPMRLVMTVVVSGLCVERERQVLLSVSAKEIVVPAGKGKPERIEKSPQGEVSALFTLVLTPLSVFVITYFAAQNKA